MKNKQTKTKKLNEVLREMWDLLISSNRKDFLEWASNKYKTSHFVIRNAYIYKKQCPSDKVLECINYVQMLLKSQTETANKLFVNI